MAKRTFDYKTLKRMGCTPKSNTLLHVGVQVVIFFGMNVDRAMLGDGLGPCGPFPIVASPGWALA